MLCCAMLCFYAMLCCAVLCYGRACAFSPRHAGQASYIFLTSIAAAEGKRRQRLGGTSSSTIKHLLEQFLSLTVCLPSMAGSSFSIPPSGRTQLTCTRSTGHFLPSCSGNQLHQRTSPTLNQLVLRLRTKSLVRWSDTQLHYDSLGMLQPGATMY